MVEFNPDGSIKIPDPVLKAKQNKEHRLKTQRCVLIRKDVTESKTPKRCILHIKISDAFPDSQFVETVYGYFKQNAETPTKLVKLNEKEFDIEIGTAFRRCSECSSLIARFRDFLDRNVIEDRGVCEYESKFSKDFCYEDYF